MAEPLRIPLHVVFYKESDRYLARCLEFDLLGDGETREDALSSLLVAIRIQVEASIEFRNIENLFNPADGKYFCMFSAGKDVAQGELHIRFRNERVVIEEPECREYEDGLALV